MPWTRPSRGIGSGRRRPSGRGGGSARSARLGGVRPVPASGAVCASGRVSTAGVGGVGAGAGGLAAVARALRARRRWFSLRPPHTPWSSEMGMAYCRHGSMTGQWAQMARAGSRSWPRRGKNTCQALSRQRAWVTHGPGPGVLARAMASPRCGLRPVLSAGPGCRERCSRLGFMAARRCSRKASTRGRRSGRSGGGGSPGGRGGGWWATPVRWTAQAAAGAGGAVRWS